MTELTELNNLNDQHRQTINDWDRQIKEGPFHTYGQRVEGPPLSQSGAPRYWSGAGGTTTSTRPVVTS